MATQSTQSMDAALANAQLVSLPRIQLMKVIETFDCDGIEFRELQAHMGMSDGKLLSNLYALRDMGLIEEAKARVENKTLTTYRITDSGRDEWSRTRQWLIEWLGTQ